MYEADDNSDGCLLSVRDLRVGFDVAPTAGKLGRRVRPPVTEVVRGISFDVRRGEILALVGESGSGKTMTALALLGLLPAGGRVLSGGALLAGTGDVLSLPEAERRHLRGRRIAMIFQDPISALNPVLTIGYQIAEGLRLHRGLGRRRALAESRDLLELVAMPDPERRLRSYPHQLSGGQLQRAMIAMAIACRPDVLLADEPTTALDVTIQAQILDLLEDLRRRLGLTVLLITHDLAVVAETADRVAVMYAGEIVEQAGVRELFRRPAHPYTRHLLAAVPRPGKGRTTSDRAPASEPRAWCGDVPEPGALPGGCAFHPRCPSATDACRRESPGLIAIAGRSHLARCFLYGDDEGGGPR